MSERISRRDFALRAATAAGGTILLGSPAATLTSQEAKDSPHLDLAQLNKKLHKPVADDLLKGVTAGLKHNDELAEARWKKKLREGSEPTSVYRAVGVKS